MSPQVIAEKGIKITRMILPRDADLKICKIFIRNIYITVQSCANTLSRGRITWRIRTRSTTEMIGMSVIIFIVVPAVAFRVMSRGRRSRRIGTPP